MWLVLRRNPHFDERMDGIVYAVCVGLGFAAVENVMYFDNEEENVEQAVKRFIFPGQAWVYEKKKEA